MSNTYECGKDIPCSYWDAIHGQNQRSIYDEKFIKKCRFCNRPIRERFAGKGIYPPNEGGITLPEDSDA